MLPVQPDRPNDSRAALQLQQAREHERAGRLSNAAQSYEVAIELAGARSTVRCEALRRLAVVRHRCQQNEAADALSRRAFVVADLSGDQRLIAEALNTRASIELDHGGINAARSGYQRALHLVAAYPELRGRIRQNLGIIANIQGDFESALVHYTESLHAYREAGDEHGCAMAFHNLGMVTADRAQWEAADRYFQQAMALAESAGDAQLRAQNLIGAAEVQLARREYNRARVSAEEALLILDALGAQRYKADAYIVLGIVFRETGDQALAEARLLRAIDLASSAGSVLAEAEASRELAEVNRRLGRRFEALGLLNRAQQLFGHLGARSDLADVAKRITDVQIRHPVVEPE